MFEHSYPLVTCGAHPEHPPRPGWMICIHIARDVRTPIAYLETPTRDELGRLLCHDCNRRRSLDTLRLACPECVADILRARELRP